MATIRDVATRAGVSISTVSHVINSTRFVDPETEKRVQAAVQELGYQPNSLARSLRRGTTNMIALIVPDNANMYFAELARSIEDAGFVKELGVILCNSDGSEQKEEIYIRSLLSRKIDGFIIIPVTNTVKRLEMIQEHNMPLVVVDRGVKGLGVDQVVVDNEQGGYQAGQYLIKMGHRRIGCICGPRNSSITTERFTGFQRALEEAGIHLSENAITYGDFLDTGGQMAMNELLQNYSELTAVFAMNDWMAIGALYTLRCAHIRVPEDISIIGFDNIKLSSLVSPTLTTIAQPLKDVGRQSVTLLLQRIRGQDTTPTYIGLPTTLVERESCMRITDIQTPSLKRGYT